MLVLPYPCGAGLLLLVLPYPCGAGLLLLANRLGTGEAAGFIVKLRECQGNRGVWVSRDGRMPGTGLFLKTYCLDLGVDHHDGFHTIPYKTALQQGLSL